MGVKSLIEVYVNDKNFNWLNFGMCEERQQELSFGAQKGLQFLKDFGWEEYKR